MKKVLVILLVSAFVGAFAFADGITFGAWGRVGYYFAQQTGTADPVVGTYPNWAGSNPSGRVGISVAGTSENIGFNVNIDSNGGAIAIGDEAKAWVKFGSALKVQVGKVQGNALRGKVGGDGGIQVESFGDEDGIFQRFYPKGGILFDFTPVEGLYIGAALDSNVMDSTGAMTTVAALIGGQYGVGYTIKDIGQVRVQYIGAGYTGHYTNTFAYQTDGIYVTQTATYTKNDSYIQAAFALTAVAGLTIDLAGKFDLDTTTGSSAILGVAYGKDALALKARIFTAFGTDIGFGAYLQASYVVAAPLAIGADITLDARVKNATSLILCPWLKFGYGQGSAIVGFKYTANFATGAVNSWAIPVAVEFGF